MMLIEKEQINESQKNEIRKEYLISKYFNEETN